MDRWEHLKSQTFENGNEEIGLLNHRKAGQLRALFWLHRGLDEDELRAAECAVGRSIPTCLRPFYRCSNGGQFFSQISIGGHVGPITRDVAPGAGQPISLAYGNVVERPPGLTDSDFVFGSIIGYNIVGKLVANETSVRLVHPRDGLDVAVECPNFELFLFSELDRLSARYDSNGRFDENWSISLPPAARHWDSV